MRSYLKTVCIVVGGILSILLLIFVIHAYTLHAQGWYRGPAEEGISRYTKVQRENVRICTTQQEDDFLYAVWENTATGEVSMTILERQNKQGRSYLRPWGASALTADGTVLDTYQYNEGTGAAQRSLVVVTCDNRSGTLDRCELAYIQSGPNGDPPSKKETVPLTEPFLLRAQWFSGNVHCVGTVIDRQGNTVARSGGYAD